MRIDRVPQAVSFVLLKGFYNIFLHPLRHYPGPRLAAFSHIWMINELRRGRFLYTLRPLHAKYGPVVRVAPNELMYIGPEPLKNIFDIKVNPEYQKDMSFLDDGFSGRSIVSALKESHRDQRRSLAPGFSEKSLRLQEPIIKDYVGQLFRLFHKKVGTSFDVVKVFNVSCIVWKNPATLTDHKQYFTFDVIGDLSYGEPFGCLANDNYHPWIQNIFGNIEGAPFNRFLGINPWLRPLVHKLMPQHIRKAVEDHVALTVEKMDRRLVSDKDRPDFLQNLVKTGNLPPRQDLYATGGALILAGSETTATALSGTTWFLWKNPEVRAKLQAELDEAFSSPEDITLVGVGQCRYLCACIDESLRLYPPQGLSNGRIVPDGGSLIDGKFVPGGVSICLPTSFPYMVVSPDIALTRSSRYPWVSATTPHTGTLSGSPKPTNTAPSAGWEIRSLPTTTSSATLHSALDHAIASARSTTPSR